VTTAGVKRLKAVVRVAESTVRSVYSVRRSRFVSFSEFLFTHRWLGSCSCV